MRPLAIAGFCSAVALTTSAAQKSIISIGMIYRYHGDTIWVERDTTVTRAIFHGDTIIKTRWLNDVQVSSQTYVVTGDSGRLIASVNQSGRSMPVTSGRSMSLEMLTMERQLLENQVRMEETRARVSSMGVMAQFEPPVFADTVRRYAVSSALQIVQYRDTVSYVRGCPRGTRLDTTTYVLYKSDSLKRVKPERMFGQAMAVSVLGTMRIAMTQERMKTLSPAPIDLPKAPDGCK